MIIIHENVLGNPNEEIEVTMDNFIKELKADGVDIKKVSYRNKTIFVYTEEDYAYVTALLDHDYPEEKQMGIRVAIQLEDGVNYDIPDPVITNEDVDKTDDAEEILLEDEPNYPEDNIIDALQVLGYTFKGSEVDGRVMFKNPDNKTTYFDDFADAQDFIINMYLNNKSDNDYKWAYDVLIGDKSFDDYWTYDYDITESLNSSDKLTLDDLKEYTILVQGMFNNNTQRDDCVYALEKLDIPYIAVNNGNMKYWLAEDDEDVATIIKTIKKYGQAVKHPITPEKWDRFKTIKVEKYDWDDSYIVK